MTKFYLLFTLLLSTQFLFAQRVNYPPAPTSVYVPYGQKNVTSQLKNALWSDNISNPANWSFSNISIPSNDWTIETEPEVVSSSGPFQSTSASDGFLFFKADTSASATSDAYAEYVGPAIDLTGQANVRIQFEQQFISDSNQRIIEVSQDGISWFPFIVSDGNSPTGAKMNDLASIDVSGVIGNAPNVFLRFQFLGNSAGYWAIDDINMCSIDTVDLRAVSTDWGTTGAWGVRMPYYSVWYSQSQPIEFCAVVENVGLVDVDTALYDVSIPVASYASSDTFSLLVGEKDTICSMSTFSPAVTNFHYHEFNQTIATNLTEQNTLNNELEDIAFTLDHFWSQYYGRDNFQNGPQGEIDASELLEYEVGNVYDFHSNSLMYAMRIGISTNAQVGAEISGSIYKFDTVSNEFVLVNISFPYTITPMDIGYSAEVQFANTSEVFLAGSSYLITAKAYGGGIGVSNVFSVSGKSKPNTSYLIDLSNGTYDFSYLTETPMVGLLTLPEPSGIGLEEVSQDIHLDVYPNPSNHFTNVSFELVQSTDMTFTIYDLSGKKMQSTKLKGESIEKGEFTLDTSHLQSGMYILEAISDHGRVTERLVIQH